MKTEPNTEESTLDTLKSTVKLQQPRNFKRTYLLGTRAPSEFFQAQLTSGLMNK